MQKSVNKILLDNFWIDFWKLISSGGLSGDHYLRGCTQEIHDFQGLLSIISVSFWHFFMKLFLIVRSYQVLVIEINILIMSALVTLETRLKVPIMAIFWRLWANLELFDLAQAFSLGHWFILRKISSMYILSRAVKDFFMMSSSEPIINTMQTRFS